MKRVLLLWLLLVSIGGLGAIAARGPVTDFILAGQSNMEGQGAADQKAEGMKPLIAGDQKPRESDPAKPTSHTWRNLEGWSVRVDHRLLASPNDALGARALRFLEDKLAAIKAVMAPEPLKQLQGVTLVLDLSHGKLRTMQYHPSADWLRANGYATNLAKCVHIPLAGDLPTPRNINQQPWVVLHELAHAYHDQVLGFEEPRIRQAYADFKRGRQGEEALRYDGIRTRHYALTDQKEFFAEMTEAYFGMNDFFPFNRAELMTAEPRIFELLQAIWGPVAGVRVKSGGAANGSAPSTSPATGFSFPDFRSLASGAQQARLLPGQQEFIFSMYGAPGDLESLRQLVGVMREQKIGNGFDPGPGTGVGAKPIFDFLATVGWPVICYSGSEMQIRGGRAVLGPENQAALAAMDRAGLFTAVQLGEWGYYFHNLAPNVSWWRGVYGQEFDVFKHLMKPRGLAGYDHRPANRQECYRALRDYFLSRQRDLLGRVISVTGHSHYEAYAGEWGARCIGLEVGENIAFTQSKLAFARGASRQWQRPWSVQVSPWFAGACTTSGSLRQVGGGARGLDAGHSLSFYERMWLHGWFAGAAMVTPENSLASFFDEPRAPWRLTSHGRKAVEVFDFMRRHDRGVPYAPIAIVLDHLAGYNAYMDKPWGILEPTAGDREVRDLFDFQLFPGSDHIHAKPFPNNPELTYLRPTPYGEVFDVFLTSVAAEMLANYPVILLAGNIEFDDAFLGALDQALRQGNRVLLSPRHRQALGPGEFSRLRRQGEVEVLESWTNTVTGRPAAISDNRLRKLAQQYLPIEVSGDPVQFQINRTPKGWVVELINNNGVIKRPDAPPVTEATAVARIHLKPRLACRSSWEWRSLRRQDSPESIDVELGPGALEFIELTLSGD